MASNGIRDQVAIVGMGCTPFGERWDRSTDDLLIDAATEAFESAGVAKDDVDAYWLGTMGSGLSGLTLSRPLKIDHKPVTHVENFCATGSEAFRNACYAVASGAYDVVMAIGVEKLKDSGFSGLVVSSPADDGTAAQLTAPAAFSLLAPAYSEKYGVDRTELKDTLTRIAWKNHYNGARNPRAQFRKEVDKETIACSPPIAGDLGIFDCSGVSVIPTTTTRPLMRSCDPPRTRTSRPASPSRVPKLPWPRSTTALRRPNWSSWRIWALPTAAWAGRKSWPGPMTSMVTCRSTPMADSSPSAIRSAPQAYACCSSAGSSCEARQTIEQGKKLAMTHNLGGRPGACVSFVSIVGSELSD